MGKTNPKQLRILVLSNNNLYRPSDLSGGLFFAFHFCLIEGAKKPIVETTGVYDCLLYRVKIKPSLLQCKTIAEARVIAVICVKKL